MKKILIPLLILSFLFPAAAFAGDEENEETEKLPVPYEEDEFPGWLLKLRRAEIILTGSLPVSFFFTGLSFDIVRYAVNGFSNVYAPGFFGNAERVPYSSDEKYIILFSTLGVSAFVSLLDFIFGEINSDG